MAASGPGRRGKRARDDGLGGRDAAPEWHLEPEAREPELERGQGRQHVEIADVAEVREPKHLALELVLPTRDLDAEGVAQVLLQRAAVDAGRREQAGRGRARSLGRDQLET